MRAYSLVRVMVMEVRIGQTCVYVKDVDLGDHFSMMKADLQIDQWGRVKAYRGSTLMFFTDLHHLPSELLMVASNELGVRAGRRSLTRIQGRMAAILAARALAASSE